MIPPTRTARQRTVSISFQMHITAGLVGEHHRGNIIHDGKQPELACTHVNAVNPLQYVTLSGSVPDMRVVASANVLNNTTREGGRQVG